MIYDSNIVRAALLGLGVMLSGCAPETGGDYAKNDLAEASASTGIKFDPGGIAALEARMGAYVTEGEFSSIHTRLVHHGEVISDFKDGITHVESQKPIADDTIYRIYSMTKPIAGVAMMMLWEEGAFKLDDPISKYVPEFENLQVLAGVNPDGSAILEPLERSPTMRELMSHTSGFAYGLTDFDPNYAAFQDRKIWSSPDMQSVVDVVAEVPLLFQPGDAWFYSIGMDIQGYIIEKLSGQSFGEFLQTRLFGPLGMVDTAFYVPDAKYDRLSEIYDFDPESGALVPLTFPHEVFRQETVAFESGGGGLVSTLNDYSKFAQMLVNDGTLNGVQFLKPETLTEMTKNVLPDGVLMSALGMDQGEVYEGLGMGLTVGTIVDAEAADIPLPNGSYFWVGAASTWFWIDPVNDLYFIAMAQVYPQEITLDPYMDLIDVSSEAVYASVVN